jgi:hypothetical protein
MKPRDFNKNDVLSWLASSDADYTADYLNRGRPYGALSADELSARWVTSFREIAADIQNIKARYLNSELKYEMDLRSIKPPYDLVRDEFNTIAARTAAFFEQLKEEDPVRYDEIEVEVQRNLDAFKKTRNDTIS